MIDSGKFNLLGVLVNAIDSESAVERIVIAAREGRPLTASALAVHGVMTGVLDPEHRYRLNQLDLVCPDGQPVRWGLNWLYRAGLRERVYGPRLMGDICRRCAEERLPIALFGGTGDVLDALQNRLRLAHPDLAIAAAIPSPFRPLRPEEKQPLAAALTASGARVVFVGLGCPRQEIWAYAFRDAVPCPIVAVGAAFNFHAGTLSQAPRWMQRVGLEWLYRLLCEPRRLWRRYVLLNPYYVALLIGQALGVKKFPLDSARPPTRDVLPG